MGEEWRIYGPPGTGKTTYLAKSIEAAIETHGSEGVLVTSFTKAAAQALVERDLPMSDANIGTLHAICFRALGNPTIAEGKIKEWNEVVGPALSMSVKSSNALTTDPLSERPVANPGDALMNDLQRLRSKMVPKDRWPRDVIFFEQAWSDWKEDNDYLDFTDLLEESLRHISVAPGNPRVIFFDEAQDAVPLQWALLRKWAKHAERFIVAGDDDQTIFSWLGATPESMLTPELPAEQMRILKQSYRLPKAVHEYADRLIHRVTRRTEKPFRAQDREGSVKSLPANFKHPHNILDVLDKHLGNGEKVMVLSSCGYMLTPTLSLLRERGYLFHNPYRRAQGAWNPISRRAESTVNKLLAYLRPDQKAFGEEAHFWTYGDIKLFVSLLKSGNALQRGAKALLDRMDESQLYSEAGIGFLCDKIFTPDAFEHIFECDLDWLQCNVTSAGAKAISYPMTIINRWGAAALQEEPLLTIGTIHSVKGAEADAVILFPDLSTAGANEYFQSGERRDAIYRMFYVGATRAKDSLYIAQAATPLSGAIYLDIAP